MLHVLVVLMVKLIVRERLKYATVTDGIQGLSYQSYGTNGTNGK